ncbi:MAG: biopolymer transporter ExbD [Planctomycetota bacterium]|nr:MAG: biopolymer transporter ExbD [Planctomycetota bacterium]
MEIRSHTESEKIEPQMAPMIDVVFQLLIFFMLTLKIIEPEGNFNINMPLGAPSSATMEEQNFPDLKVKLRANPDGSLAALMFGGTVLGNDEAAFERLNRKILEAIGTPGGAATKETEVEIDADYNLDFRYVIRAISACTGRMQGKQLIRYVEKIKFAPPKKPPQG